MMQGSTTKSSTNYSAALTNSTASGQWRHPEATEQIEHAGATSHVDPAQSDRGEFGT
jgi:hypothetical protein